MRQPPGQTNLVERVYSRLLDTICSGGLEPGTRLTQEWLAERLNVSRQPVGQALTLLKSQGFVCEVGRRGLMVAPVDPAFVESIYAVRGALDQLAAQSAARKCDDRAKARHATTQGKRIIANGRKALASKSISDLIVADIEFHSFVYELSGNPVIGETMDLLWNRLRRVMSAYLTHIDWASDTWKEHSGILDAILAGDAETAKRLASAHADTAIHLLQQEFSAGDSTRDLGLAPISRASSLIGHT